MNGSFFMRNTYIKERIKLKREEARHMFMEVAIAVSKYHFTESEEIVSK